MKFYSLVIFFSLLICFSFVSKAFACRCVPPPFSYRWNKSDAVFIGKVVEVKPLYKYTWSAYDDKPVEVTFNVVEHLKGDEAPVEEGKAKNIEEKGKRTIKKVKKIFTNENEETFVLNTSLQNLTCMGYPFKEGEQYLVYGYKRTLEASEKWSLYNFPSETYGVGGLCGGTRSYKTSREEMKRIRMQIDEDMRIFRLKQMEKKKK